MNSKDPIYVLVDDAKNSYGRMKMSHMIAETDEELHDMADKLGLKRKWFQPTPYPHYDICQTKRKLAVDLGAIEVTVRELVKAARKWKKNNVERK